MPYHVALNITPERFIACQPLDPDYFHINYVIPTAPDAATHEVLFDRDKKGTCITMTVSTPHFYERTTSLYLTRFFHTSTPHQVLYSSNDLCY